MRLSIVLIIFFLFIEATLAAYLEVYLNFPDTTVINEVVQNRTFIVNASVICRGGNCGDVYGTVRYNLTSLNPDTPVNISFGDKPFFINETPASAMKACPQNPLQKDQQCTLTWVINATGNINTSWKIGVFFNSSKGLQNHTDNATVKIVGCSIFVNIYFNNINFGNLMPSTMGNEALGNTNLLYNISLSEISCNADIYFKATNLTNSSLNSVILVGNMSFNNISNNYTTSFRFNENYQLAYKNLSPLVNKTFYFFLDVPPIYAGIYNGTLFIKAVRVDEIP